MHEGAFYFSDLKESGEEANNEDSNEKILVDDDDDDGQAEDGDRELNGSLEDHKKQPKNTYDITMMLHFSLAILFFFGLG